MWKESFDEKYASRKLYWGNKPSSLVKNFASLAQTGRALDLGMGEGRDTLFLARQGFSVTGIDHSEVGIEKCLSRAEKEGLQVNAIIGDVRKFKIARAKYSLIVANSLFQYITKSEAQGVARHIMQGLKKGGVVIASVFTYDDPRYKEFKRKTTELEPGSFLSVNGDIYSLYDFRELLCFFDPLRLLYYSEYDYLHNHGGRGEHWHGVAELVARKK